MKYSINKIEDEMSSNGSHWWDRDSMRFFRTRVGEQVYQGPGGIYFVTSERNHIDPRKYSVRQYHPASKDIDTVGDFCSMSRSTAHAMAKNLASTPLQEQFDNAMYSLDRAVTGKDKSTMQSKYGDINEIREGGSAAIMYLSDGGYTRVSASEYDSGGFYLEVIATFATDDKNEAVKQKFRDAFDLQSEVCRVLKTEPAGNTLGVTSEVHVQATPSQQLAIDIVRGGGRCSNQTAGELIKFARRHHRLMEDYCNGIDIYDSEGEPLPKLQRVRNSIDRLLTKCNCTAIYSGDPRGCTVKLTLPSGDTNDFVKEGWCIPIR